MTATAKAMTTDMQWRDPPESVRGQTPYLLPPSRRSPQVNPTEGVWKATRKLTTQNLFYATTTERDAALRHTFGCFQRRPGLISAHVARFR